MRRDTIFYQLFLQSPALLFDLIPGPPADANEYVFRSIEVKETSFRIDGVFLPPTPEGLIFFCEAQFQPDATLYERLVSEIGIYAFRYRDEFKDWRALVIYPSRSTEQSRLETVQDIIESGRITRIYLDELAETEDSSIGIRLMLLTTLGQQHSIETAKAIIAQTQDSPEARAIIGMVSTIVVYKFNNLSRAEVEAMLGIELQQTRVYQEAKEEGREEGRQAGRQAGETTVVLKLLQRKLGKLPDEIQAQIMALSIEQLELLAEELLDFSELKNLTAWLSAHQ
jgi:predicted transposase/invertase (TIGR01784 family)